MTYALIPGFNKLISLVKLHDFYSVSQIKRNINFRAINMYKPGSAVGRPKGSQNKIKAISRSFKEYLESKNINLPEMIFSIVKRQELIIERLQDDAEKLKAWNDLQKNLINMLPYVTSRLKEQEDKSDQVVETDFIDAIEKASTQDIIKVLRASTDNK